MLTPDASLGGKPLLDDSSRRFHRLPAGMPPLRLLVVDDDAPLRKVCCDIAVRMGFIPLSACSVPEAMDMLNEQHPVDMVLLDLKLPGGGGLKLLNEVKALYPKTGVVMMTAFATVSSAVKSMRIGACDYLTKPFALNELTAVLERSSRNLSIDLESRLLRERIRTERGMGDLIGTSRAMEKVYGILCKVAALSNYPVLILGESGTGKELVAHSIHSSGPHAAEPFIPVNCGALPPIMLERELFGHLECANLGANRDREGLLCAVDRGTVFLDKIDELPIDMQAKLSRALQEREVRPLGGTCALPITVRVLAATRRDLAAMVAQRLFRNDLYLRLNVMSLTIPPLRERREDIAVLAEHFLERFQRESGKEHTFSEDAVQLMTEYDWPGNVRELQHAIERMCAMASGQVLHMADLPTQLQVFRKRLCDADTSASVTGDGVGETRADKRGAVVSIANMEKQAILQTIRQLKGDKMTAARLLGIGKTTLYRKLKGYGLDDTDELMNNSEKAPT